MFAHAYTDDMGLGKTPQALTMIYVTLERGPNGGVLNCDQQHPTNPAVRQMPTLIVCPNTATSMWLEKCRE